MTFRPLLAAAVNLMEIEKLTYPLLGSPKIDGIRVLIKDGRAVTRSLKDVRNKHVFDYLSKYALDGMDGEVVVGDLEDPRLFRQTSSGVMSAAGKPDFTYYTFDCFPEEPNDTPYWGYKPRLARLHSNVSAIGRPRIKVLPHADINDMYELCEYEAECVAKGYEGIMLRDPMGKYKFGRSTVNEQILLKVKRFQDAEAKIIGFVERMHNANEATINALGFTERTSHKDNKRGRGDLGALKVRDIISGNEFNIGSGFDDQTRLEIWTNQDKYLGKLVKYKYMGYGEYNTPRFPTYEGIRDQEDM